MHTMLKFETTKLVNNGEIECGERVREKIVIRESN